VEHFGRHLLQDTGVARPGAPRAAARVDPEDGVIAQAFAEDNRARRGYSFATCNFAAGGFHSSRPRFGCDVRTYFILQRWRETRQRVCGGTRLSPWSPCSDPHASARGRNSPVIRVPLTSFRSRQSLVRAQCPRCLPGAVQCFLLVSEAKPAQVELRSGRVYCQALRLGLFDVLQNVLELRPGPGPLGQPLGQAGQGFTLVLFFSSTYVGQGGKPSTSAYNLSFSFQLNFSSLYGIRWLASVCQ
jgi:hypothetical protein